MKIIWAAPLDLYNYNIEDLGLIDRLFLKSERERPNFNRRMFNEDFARIFGASSRRGELLFNIDSNHDELTQKLFGNIRTRNGFRNIDETVRELIEDIAQSLIWTGTAYYFLNDSSQKNEIYITPFSANGVFHFLSVHFQWVPKRSANFLDSDNEELSRELRILDIAKLIRFRMPKYIRGMLSKLNKTLLVLDNHQYDGTGFYPQVTHENPNPTNNFDFRAWKYTQEIVLQHATRNTGWNCRTYDSSKRSDFFVCHRLIRFRRNQLNFRDHLLNQMSNEFTRVGRQYNAEFHIAISPSNALPKVEELDELEARLSREEVTFSEVLDFCYERKTS